ncbi:MAG: His/Gly/Thr/Pro-type tRNA ligase C-terminal domain-containing protein [Candidatus Hodarchaeales archaeon]|jgi:prolyl-tRNA synthetase
MTDWSERTPGWKFNHWEAMGVPIRLEIGPREVSSGKIVLAQRDTREKAVISPEDLINKISSILGAITSELAIRAQEWFQNQLWEITTIEEAASLYSERKGIVKLPWCGKDECGQTMEEQLVGSALGYRIEDDSSAAQKLCAHCQRPAKHLLHFGRTY